MLVPFSFEESVPQMPWQDKLFSLGWHPDFWRPLLPRHQETPAGVLHMWCVMNQMPDADMVCMCESRKQTFFLCLVPRYLLEDVGRGSVDPFLISDYTHGEINPGNSSFWLLLTGVWAQSPLTCRWMVYWPHLQATKCALYQLCGDDWKNIGYVMLREPWLRLRNHFFMAKGSFLSVTIITFQLRMYFCSRQLAYSVIGQVIFI